MSNSKTPVVQFSLELNERPLAILDPSKSHWEHRIQNSEANLNLDLIWSTRYSRVLTSIKKAKEGQISVPSYAVQPGSSVNGFQLATTIKPGPAQYHLRGYQERTVLYEDGSFQLPDITCTNIDMEGPPDRMQVTGMTVGPVDPHSVSLKLRLRKKESSERFIAFDAKNSDGEISVVILSDPTLKNDPLVLSSLKFGADEAKVLASKEIDEAFTNSKDDERATWENQSDEVSEKDKVSSSKNLLLNFKIKDLGVKCGLDKSLFLSGATKSGKKVFGGVDIKILGCEVGKPGIRKILNERYRPNC